MYKLIYNWIIVFAASFIYVHTHTYIYVYLHDRCIPCTLGGVSMWRLTWSSRRARSSLSLRSSLSFRQLHRARVGQAPAQPHGRQQPLHTAKWRWIYAWRIGPCNGSGHFPWRAVRNLALAARPARWRYGRVGWGRYSQMVKTENSLWPLFEIFPTPWSLKVSQTVLFGEYEAGFHQDAPGVSVVVQRTNRPPSSFRSLFWDQV